MLWIIEKIYEGSIGFDSEFLTEVTCTELEIDAYKVTKPMLVCCENVSLGSEKERYVTYWYVIKCADIYTYVCVCVWMCMHMCAHPLLCLDMCVKR